MSVSITDGSGLSLPLMRKVDFARFTEQKTEGENFSPVFISPSVSLAPLVCHLPHQVEASVVTPIMNTDITFTVIPNCFAKLRFTRKLHSACRK